MMRFHKAFQFAIVAVAAVAALAAGAVYAGAQTPRPGPTPPILDDAAAGKVIGHTLPVIHGAPGGLYRIAVSVDPDYVAVRAVHESYAVNGRPLLLLTIRPGSVESIDAGETVTLAGMIVQVHEKKIQDGTTNVNYVWNRDGLSFVMNVNLVNGLTRPLADTLVASVY